MQTMASHSVSPSLLGHPPFTEPIDIESEIEDEVDQLDSDSDGEDSEPDASNASMKKSGSGRGGERTPGHSVLPALRLENIIQADGVTGNLALSKEGLFILSIATEEFIKRLAQGGQRQASAERRNLINYRDMAATTQQYQEFMFLNDTIPAPLSLSEALQMREAKEKELLEEDPAMSTSTSMHFSASTSTSGPSHSNIPKGKGRIRATNGKERTNTGTSGSGFENRSDSRGRWSYGPGQDGTLGGGGRVDGAGGTWIDWSDGQAPSLGPDHLATRPAQNGVTSASAARVSPIANGQNSTAYVRSRTLTPTRSRDERMEPPSPPHHPHHSHTSSFLPQDENWPGQYTGPASGFLQDPRGPFGRVAQNPGRTIYSHQHRPQ